MNNLIKYKSLLLSSVILIAIVITTIVFVLPKITQALETRDAIEKDKNSLAQLTSKLAILKGLDTQELETKNQVVLKVLPAIKDPVTSFMTIKELTKIASLSAVSLEVSPGEMATASAKKTPSKAPVFDKNEKQYNLVYSVSAFGTKDQIKNFISNIEKTTPLMNINEFAMVSGADDIVELKTEVASLFYSLPTTLGKMDSPIVSLSSQDNNTYQLASDYQTLAVQSEFINLPVGKSNPFTP